MPNSLPDENMDDLTARVGRLETIAADTRADVAAIKATLPHLATKPDMSDPRAELKADIGRLDARIERVDGNVARMEASMVRWFVGLTVACGGVAGSLAFTAAKLIHRVAAGAVTARRRPPGSLPPRARAGR
jgi:hypothetical protein